MGKRFLTPERRELISRFLQDGKKSQTLIILKNEMNAELNRYLDDVVPCSALTYRNANKKAGIQCPAEVLYRTFIDLLEDDDILEKILRQKYYSWRDPRFSLLDDYDRSLKDHWGNCRLCPERRESLS